MMSSDSIITCRQLSFDRNNNEEKLSISSNLLQQIFQMNSNNSQQRKALKRPYYGRYVSGSSSDSAINFENQFEEEDDVIIENDSFNLHEDFNLVIYNFICLVLQQKLPLDVTCSKKIIGIIKRHINWDQHLNHIDRFGFIKKKLNLEPEIDRLCLEYIANDLLNARSNLYWHLNCENIKCSIREYGIPNELRAQIWITFIKAKLDPNLDIEVLLSKADQTIEESCPNDPILRQIDLDVPRTFPTHIMFNSNPEGSGKLRRVLISYCIHVNPSIGYCQGMNFIAAFLMIVFDGDERDSLMGLICLIDHYFPPHYYDSHLTGARADQMILKDLIISRILPDEFKNTFTPLMLDEVTSALTLNWFLSLFHGAVPWQIRLQILDCFWVEGVKVIFRFSLALLKLGISSCTLTDESSVGDIINTIRNTSTNYYDVFELKRIAFSEMKIPKRKYLAVQRSFYAKRIVSMTQSNSSDTEEKIPFWVRKKKKELELIKCKIVDCDDVCQIVASHNCDKIAVFKQNQKLNDNEICILDVDGKHKSNIKSKFIKDAVLVGITDDGKTVIFCQNSSNKFKKLTEGISIEIIGFKHEICAGYYLECIKSTILISTNGIITKVKSGDKNSENTMILSDETSSVITTYLIDNIIWVNVRTRKEGDTHQLMSFDVHSLDVCSVIQIDCQKIFGISLFKENIFGIFVTVESGCIGKIEQNQEDFYQFKLLELKYDDIVDLRCFHLESEEENKESNVANASTYVTFITKSGSISTLVYHESYCQHLKKRLPFPYVENTKIIKLTKDNHKLQVVLASSVCVSTLFHVEM